MITIDEKLNLFTKIVYDLVEKENRITIEKYNKEFGSLIEEKRQEFTREAQEILSKRKKNLEKEKLQIVSKARIQQKKILLEKRKELLEKMIIEVEDIAREFVKSQKYKDMFIKELKSAFNEVCGSDEFIICLTEKDAKDFEREISDIFSGKKVSVLRDNDIIGGFVLTDRDKNIKFDLSFLSRISNSRNLIGEKLLDLLH
ncbi:hypothetical protein Q428_04830 [Fervidicella metallireducens AeB]|uniref:V-type proton ATPase subunit E n=1 Tax=Fervidicella metallireducens AeB TaxID=1403537 RepID=A0A017RYM1_9CLOT|nr:V-type ATP synthase subunit E [Fervidicella metallireducens]EYE89020.1 hypothetical protein Q428_04830 [Fervidicella metallireducens AeB]